ncbi:MAG TPA: hypothetical protein VIH04_05645 [Nitrosarchaeum sp.]
MQQKIVVLSILFGVIMIGNYAYAEELDEYIRIDLEKFVKPESARDYQEITITGHVNGYTRGDNIVITIISPDKSEEEISTYASRDGDVYTLLHMTEESQIGNYKMILKYDGTERASTEFEIMEP